MAEWFSPGAIQWTQEQTLWVLGHYDELRNGDWPSEGGGYIDPAIAKPSPSAHAPYEVAVQISAEVSRRLEDCGYDGAMLLLHYAYGQTIEAIAKYFWLDEERVNRRMETVLRHISRRNYRVGRYRRWNAARGAK